MNTLNNIVDLFDYFCLNDNIRHLILPLHLIALNAIVALFLQWNVNIRVILRLFGQGGF